VRTGRSPSASVANHQHPNRARKFGFSYPPLFRCCAPSDGSADYPESPRMAPPSTGPINSAHDCGSGAVPLTHDTRFVIMVISLLLIWTVLISPAFNFGKCIRRHIRVPQQCWASSARTPKICSRRLSLSVPPGPSCWSKMPSRYRSHAPWIQ